MTRRLAVRDLAQSSEGRVHAAADDVSLRAQRPRTAAGVRESKLICLATLANYALLYGVLLLLLLLCVFAAVLGVDTR